MIRLPVLALAALVIGLPSSSGAGQQPSSPDVHLKRSARLRETPDGRWKEQGRAGSLVELLERDGEWIRVSLAGGATGWVHERDLDRRLTNVAVPASHSLTPYDDAAPMGAPVGAREPQPSGESVTSEREVQAPARRIVAFEAPPVVRAPEPAPAPASASTPAAESSLPSAISISSVPALISTPQGPLRVRLTPLPSDARLLREPDPRGGMVATLAAGTQLQFLERSGEHVHVRTREGLQGWIPMTALRPVAFPPATLALLSSSGAPSLVEDRSGR